jgi:lambda repressor-like predicted transcriptional regulator
MEIDTDAFRARLNSAIEKSGKSRTGISLAAGQNHTYLRDLLDRKQMPAVDRLVAIANEIDVSLLWLLSGEDEMQSPSKPVMQAPVLSWTEVAALYPSAPTPPAADESIAAKNTGGDLIAVQVADNTMNRVAASGAYIIVDRKQREPKDNLYYIARTADQIVFRQFRDGDGPPRLEPDGLEKHPTIFPAEGWDVVGRVVQIIDYL